MYQHREKLHLCSLHLIPLFAPSSSPGGPKTVQQRSRERQTSQSAASETKGQGSRVSQQHEEQKVKTNWPVVTELFKSCFFIFEFFLIKFALSIKK